MAEPVEKSDPKTAGAGADKRPAPPSFLFSLIRLFGGIMGLVIVVVGVTYYLYTTRQEELLNERSLRALRTISAQVEATLSGLDTLVRRRGSDTLGAGLVPILAHAAWRVAGVTSAWAAGDCASLPVDTTLTLGFDTKHLTP